MTTNTRKTLLTLVVPVFNEQDAIAPFLDSVRPILDEIFAGYDSAITGEILFVDDGSSDGTLGQLIAARRSDPRIKIVQLSRNFGKDIALTAGLDHAIGAAVVPIDVDLQDPPEVIPELLGRWFDGYDVVDVIRADRQSDSWFKRVSAALYYRFHNLIAEQPIQANAGDFRLLDRKVVEAVKQMPERARLMKCLCAWVGFRRTAIKVARAPRSGGKSKWKYWRLWNLALDGITSSSTMPLRIWSYLGVAVAFLAFCYAVFLIGRTIVIGVDVPGYASIMVAVLFFGGINLLSLGVIGEYLGRSYIESRQRPLYIIADTFGFKDAINASEHDNVWTRRSIPAWPNMKITTGGSRHDEKSWRASSNG